MDNLRGDPCGDPKVLGGLGGNGSSGSGVLLSVLSSMAGALLVDGALGSVDNSLVGDWAKPLTCGVGTGVGGALFTTSISSPIPRINRLR